MLSSDEVYELCVSLRRAINQAPNSVQLQQQVINYILCGDVPRHWKVTAGSTMEAAVTTEDSQPCG